MQASQAVINKIKEFEGCQLRPYLDVAGYPTIGYGNRFYVEGASVTMRDPVITRDFANIIFSRAIQKVEEWLNKTIKCILNQNQFDACCSFFYNLGYSNFSKNNPNTWKHLTQGKLNLFAQDMLLFTHAGKWELTELVTRRKWEYQLFNSVP